MTEDRSGGIASFGVGFGSRKQGEGGEEAVSERTFRVVVIAEVVAGPDWSTGRTPPLDPLRIDAETFDGVMGQLAPSLGIEVNDPFGAGDPPLRVDIVWRDRKSMRPAELVEQVPALRALVDARRVVQDVAARKLTAEAARAQLVRILPRPSWADALVREVRPAPVVSHEAPKAAPAPRPTPGPAAGNGSGKSGLDALLDIEPRRTEPLFEELVSQDDLVFARAPERCDFEYYVGHRTVLSRRLRDVAEFLEFGPDERNLLLSRLHSIPAA